jgi:hypothetical protein
LSEQLPTQDRPKDSIDQIRQEHPEHLARFRAAPILRPGLNLLYPRLPMFLPNRVTQVLTRHQTYPVSGSAGAGAGWPRSPRNRPVR